MQKKYSIAETRDNLASLVHDLERIDKIEITRRGKSVAVLISIQEYERLQSRQSNFWDAYQSFIKDTDLTETDIDPDEVFADLREKSPGREIKL